MGTAAVATPLDRAVEAREARSSRFAALAVDIVVFGVLTFVVNSVYGVTQVTSTSLSGSGTMTATTTAVAWPWLTLLGILYFAIPEAMFGASPGKQLMGVKVVRVDGGPLAIRDVLIRNVLKPIDFLPVLYLLGGLTVVLSRAAQRIGDMAAGTTVIHATRATAPGATRTSSRRAKIALAATLAIATLFTAGFDYFGRPPLVIQGAVNAGEEPLTRVDSYELGAPTWGWGRVTYPLTFPTRVSPTGVQVLCRGAIGLEWDLGGWHIASADYRCA